MITWSDLGTRFHGVVRAVTGYGPRTFGLRRSVAALLAVAAAVTGLAYLPSRFQRADEQVAAFAELTPEGRLLRSARGVDVDTGIYLLAQRVIPVGATYYVTTGPGVHVSTPVTYDGVGPFAILFLMPRMPVQNVHDARYVISYGGDLSDLGVAFARVWTYKPGLQVAEVRP